MNSSCTILPERKRCERGRAESMERDDKICNDFSLTAVTSSQESEKLHQQLFLGCGVFLPPNGPIFTPSTAMSKEQV